MAKRGNGEDEKKTCKESPKRGSRCVDEEELKRKEKVKES